MIKQKVSRMVLETLHTDDATLNKIFFTDEAWFYNTGYMNSQNMRIWSADTAPEKLDVWIAISGRIPIGLITFEGKNSRQKIKLRW
jgi:hypothetical protein